MAATLAHAVTDWADRRPDRVAFRYLVTGDADGPVHEFTYAQLARRARAVAARLGERGLAGSRAMLLYPPGLEFIAAYLGCLLAGVVAVPAVAPHGRSRNQRALTRLRRLIADADARVVLSAAPVLAGLAAADEDLAEMDCVATEEIPDADGDGFRERAVEPGDVAFLQYTSGSTTAPRGVAITHANLMDNQRLITATLGHTPGTVDEYGGEMFVSWLPMYHDMGLIGPVLNNVHIGATATLFSPLHFLQRPQRWPAAIARFRPHTSGGPNFAYELCLRTAGPELLAGLDLGRWRVAFNGAEPVRAGTLRRFAEAFAPAGFRAEAFYPCYGLAEATLMVTGGAVGEPPVLLPREASELVGCGTARPGVTVLVVDPQTRTECPAGEVGEIWVAGGSVARGYWRNALATRETFGATLTDGRGGFLRTGDLGLLRDGELYVTGRLKDLLVIDGRNHYPQDLELLAEAAHPALRPGCSAAFSVDDPAAGEQPVIVAEASPEAAPDVDAIAALIRGAVGEAHGLALRDVVLVEPGTIPKTSSGKIQRRASRAAYLDGTLSVVGADRRAGA